MAKETKIVDCPSPDCDGKVDLAGDDTECPKCGVDVGIIQQRYKQEAAYANYKNKQDAAKAPVKKKSKGWLG